jgi:DNA-binding response OmpR family regulator/septal ring-binding cell division protein DamX
MKAKTILVIDTEIETIQKIMTALESEGFLVFKASNRDSGLFTAKKVKPSIIFINMGIRGASGLEICKTIHENEALNHIPIVIITERGGMVDSRDTTLYGIVDFLKKPFTTEELAAKTNTILKGHYLNLQLEQTPGPDIVSEIIDEQESKGKSPGVKSVEYHPEKYVTAQPIGKTGEVHPSEECPEYTTEESPTEKEEKRDIQYIENETIPPGTLLAESQQEQRGRHVVEGVNEKKINGKNEELFSDDTIAPEYYAKPLTRKGAREHKRGSLLVLLFILIGIISFSGFLFYINFIKGTAINTTKEESPLPQVQREVVNPQTPVEIEITQDIEKRKPAEMPAPVPETKPEAKPFYTIQIGVFKVEANARSFNKQYQEKGYDTYVAKSTTEDGEILYRVFIGTFENRKEAVQAARAIRTKEKTQTMIVRR